MGLVRISYIGTVLILPSTKFINMMTPSKRNVFPVTGPFGEFTGHRWISLKKATDAELWYFSLICTWINDWVNNREAGDLRRHRAHYDVIIMEYFITVCSHVGGNEGLWSYCFFRSYIENIQWLYVSDLLPIIWTQCCYIFMLYCLSTYFSISINYFDRIMLYRCALCFVYMCVFSSMNQRQDRRHLETAISNWFSWMKGIVFWLQMMNCVTDAYMHYMPFCIDELEWCPLNQGMYNINHHPRSVI